jgi:hypothetical protein
MQPFPKNYCTDDLNNDATDLEQNSGQCFDAWLLLLILSSSDTAFFFFFFFFFLKMTWIDWN